MIPTDFAKNVYIYKKYIRRVEFRYFVYKKKKKISGETRSITLRKYKFSLYELPERGPDGLILMTAIKICGTRFPLYSREIGKI